MNSIYILFCHVERSEISRVSKVEIFHYIHKQLLAPLILRIRQSEAEPMTKRITKDTVQTAFFIFRNYQNTFVWLSLALVYQSRSLKLELSFRLQYQIFPILWF